MGAFHCPVGAVGYGGEGCIDCKMCMAKTDPERVAATEIIRKFLRENASLRTDRRIRKIAVCGKGGAGKSTVSALLALALEDYGYKVLLIDTDDSNMGLYRKVGCVEEPKQVYEIGINEKESWAEKDPLLIDDIPEDQVVSVGNIKVIGIGKIVNPFQGCSCDPMEFARKLVLNLTPKDDEIIIADQDAGLESFGRGVEQGCDTVITIVEPSFDSIEMASKMQYMAEGFGIRRVRAVVSKVEDEEESEIIMDALADNDIRYLGAIEKDKTITKSNLLGKSLKETASYEKGRLLAKYLLDEAEMKIFNK